MLEGENSTPAKTRMYVNPGLAASSDTMADVPIVKADDLPRVPHSLKDEVLAGSGWNPMGTLGEGSNSESSEPEEIILREPDWDSVPLFKRPTSPEILKEFAHMFGSSWVLLGTPEAGLGVLALMELRLPVIALTRNEAHTKGLEATVDERLANAVLMRRRHSRIQT